jgi:hypothetical protein
MDDNLTNDIDPSAGSQQGSQTAGTSGDFLGNQESGEYLGSEPQVIRKTLKC